MNKKDSPPYTYLEKHKIYKSKYKKNDTYWGLGIENEVYLEFDLKKVFTKEDFAANHKAERYSVDYFSNYKPDFLKKSMSRLANSPWDSIFEVPILVKSHSFSKTDMMNQPETSVQLDYKKNPRFSGKTLLDKLGESNPYFKSSQDEKWLFDGDTIEFPTRDFYKVTLDKVIKELRDAKTEFVSELNTTMQKENIFETCGSVKIMEQNYPFATYLTNLENIAMFNNGTLHYNLTLPTELDENGIVKDYKRFIYEHSKACKIIQWMEPFFVAVYGAGDPFYKLNSAYPDIEEHVSAASQRCAISRYIGIGTFDTDKMETGKILTLPIEEIMKPEKEENWWFHKFYERSAYNKLNELGLDINFHKHYNHGIEIRFFDHLSDEKRIEESFRCILHLMDYILETDDIENPVKSEQWNDFVYKTMKQGKDYSLNQEEMDMYMALFRWDQPFKSEKIGDIYNEILDRLTERYIGLDVYCCGLFSKTAVYGKMSKLCL
jgi:hypothetical protein